MLLWVVIEGTDTVGNTMHSANSRIPQLLASYVPFFVVVVVLLEHEKRLVRSNLLAAVGSKAT